MGQSETRGLHASIIIPNWNGRQHLARCLPAVFAQDRLGFQTTVVDNGSNDGSVAWLQENYPAVEIVALEQNLGFAAACNAGIRAAKTDLIITLNNDTVPRPEWLASLLDAVERYPEAGMFAATLWLDGEPPLVDAAGIEVDRLGVAWNVDRGQPASDLPTAPRPAFGPCAGAALYRRELLDDVGFFDEGYFAYLEDVELAWRARWAGWQCIWVPDAIVRHAHSATGGQNLPRKFWLLGRNRLWTILRHYPRPYLWRRLPLILANEVLTGVLAMIALRHPAPVLGRMRAVRHWRMATQPPFGSPRRIAAAEMEAILAPGPSLGARWVRYAPIVDSHP